jgi:DNA-binding NtrC family response regulator
MWRKSMANSENLIVLLIDDEPDILELMEDEFKEAGFKTYSCKSGNEGIEILKNHPINVVVSDYKMSNGTGLVVLEYVRKMVTAPTFYFASGQSDISVEETLKAGARRFFLKPYDFDQLVKVILCDHS